MIYLDGNATSPMRPQASLAMAAALGHVGNPSSVHRQGQGARRMVEAARSKLAQALDVPDQAVIFTSGGSEANDLALRGVDVDHVIISAIEHDSVAKTAASLGKPLSIAPVDRHGVIDLGALDEILAQASGHSLVSIMAANNETGVIQPVAEAARMAKARGAIVHVDAVQALGKIDVSGLSANVDLITVSAHKMGGPLGIGALIARDVEVAPRILGGAQERFRRAGTENVPAIVGFGAALDAIEDGEALARLRDRFEAGIQAMAPEAVILGQGAPRLPNTSLIAYPGLAAETQVIALDLAGVAVSSGAACSSGKVRKSAVVTAMGRADLADCAVRFSLTWASRDSDLDHALAAYGALIARHRPAANKNAA